MLHSFRGLASIFNDISQKHIYICGCFHPRHSAWTNDCSQADCRKFCESWYPRNKSSGRVVSTCFNVSSWGWKHHKDWKILETFPEALVAIERATVISIQSNQNWPPLPSSPAWPFSSAAGLLGLRRSSHTRLDPRGATHICQWIQSGTNGFGPWQPPWHRWHPSPLRKLGRLWAFRWPWSTQPLQNKRGSCEAMMPWLMPNGLTLRSPRPHH